MNDKKRLILGITASVAIYKICDLIRLFKKSDVEIIPVMTPDAMRFISPLLIESLCQNRVYSDMFDESGGAFYHIMLSKGAGLILIAPATANTIAKLSAGIADNLLTSTVLASKCPVLVAPAMNVRMFENQITQENIKRLKSINRFSFIMPESGELACGDTGSGRLADINDIFDASLRFLFEEKILKGKRILVSAGPTREYMDPVRFLSNPSTGKMGYELARMAYWLGADVTLIFGPVNIRPPYGLKVINVLSADDMKKAILGGKDRYDILIMGAAVSDWKFSERASQKIKRDGKMMQINLIENEDIIKLAARSGRFGFILGFAAESEKTHKNAIAKIQKKKIDAIVVNDISKRDIGFGADYNAGSIIYKDGKITNIARCSKREMAYKIYLDIIERIK